MVIYGGGDDRVEAIHVGFVALVRLQTLHLGILPQGIQRVLANLHIEVVVVSLIQPASILPEQRRCDRCGDVEMRLHGLLALLVPGI